jgi:hypothetical protein
MIQITKIINYMRPLVTNMRVDGAAALANAKDDSRLMVEGDTIIPTLFVMLGDFNATTLALETFLQEYDERLVIIACIDNKQDRTGKYAQQFVYSLRIALFQMLLNYEYDPNSHSLQYVGDKMLEMDRARYWHKFEFKLLGRLDESDGVQLKLTNFNEFVANWNSADPIADNPLAIDDLIPLYDIPS